MEKIKVINVITRLIVGGAQETVMETCDCLDSDRYDPLIISGEQTGPEGEIISEVRKRHIPLTIMPELVRQVSPVKDLLAFIKLVMLFKAKKPQIVHTHSSKAGILGRWAAWVARVPVIVHTVHGWGHTVYNNPVKRGVFTFLEKKSADISDRLIVVSYLNAEKGMADGIGNEQKYTTIHSSIDLDDFTDPVCDVPALKKQLGLSPESPVIGTVARFSPQKNPADFVRVAAEVKKQVPQAQFLYIGDGPLRSETEELIEELDLTSDIFLPGLRRDVPQLLKCMDVFILSSLWEGLPRVIPQAMAAGLPVVANGVDGVCEIIKDQVNGFLIPPEDVSLMAKRIVQILQDSTLREKMIGEGSRTAEKEFSLKGMVKIIEDLYEELILKKQAVKIKKYHC